MGLRALGTPPQAAEETAGDAPPRRTSVMVASTCTLAPWALGLLNQDGERVLHRNMQAAPEAFRKAMAPSREARVVAGAWRLTWDWRADRCAQDQMPGVLGPAVSMHARHGGQATHDTLDAQPIAMRRRGGRRPPADVDPAARRATRAVRRRRFQLTRQRAARRAPVQHTTRQDTRPASGKPLADQAHRDGGAARFPAPAGHKRVDVDRARIDAAAQRRSDGAWPLVQTAQPPQAPTLERRPSGPGLGTIGRVGLLEALHDSTRGPRLQDVVASGRLGPGAKASAGTRDGTSGATIGQAALPWAFSAAAVRGWRHHPAGQTALARVETPQGPGHALSVCAPPWARAVADRRTRTTAFARPTGLTGSWRGAGEPTASRDEHGRSRAWGARRLARRPGPRRSTSALGPRSRGRGVDLRSGS